MKQKILVDVGIKCEPELHKYYRDIERQAQRIESWLREFLDFIRDHQSQDTVRLNIHRIYEEQCSFCYSEWETGEDGCPVCCGAAIEEWKAQQNKTRIEIPEPMR